jgi:carboxylesterase
MMRYRHVPADTQVHPRFLPLFHEGGKAAVLGLHGFTGTPSEFAYLAGRLADTGYTVSVPRLPGHGTNLQDFLQTGWQDWLRAALDACFDLRSRYQPVYIVGLSMGGLLALILAARLRPEKLVLAAPALRVHKQGYLSASPLLKHFIRRTLQAERKEYEEEELDALAREYWDYHQLAQLAQLRHLQKMALRLLPRLSSPTLTIVSEHDSLVPPGVADLIETRRAPGKGRRLVLQESSHVVIDGSDKVQVADEIIAWLSS